MSILFNLESDVTQNRIKATSIFQRDVYQKMKSENVRTDMKRWSSSSDDRRGCMFSFRQNTSTQSSRMPQNWLASRQMKILKNSWRRPRGISTRNTSELKRYCMIPICIINSFRLRNLAFLLDKTEITFLFSHTVRRTTNSKNASIMKRSWMNLILRQSRKPPSLRLSDR